MSSLDRFPVSKDWKNPGRVRSRTGASGYVSLKTLNSSDSPESSRVGNITLSYSPKEGSRYFSWDCTKTSHRASVFKDFS